MLPNPQSQRKIHSHIAKENVSSILYYSVFSVTSFFLIPELRTSLMDQIMFYVQGVQWEDVKTNKLVFYNK